MQVLSWPHRRHLLIKKIGQIEPEIAVRADALQRNWAAVRENGLYDPEPSTAAEAAPAPPPAPTVPDYLR
jgi:hypothetical protein